MSRGRFFAHNENERLTLSFKTELIAQDLANLNQILYRQNGSLFMVHRAIDGTIYPISINDQKSVSICKLYTLKQTRSLLRWTIAKTPKIEHPNCRKAQVFNRELPRPIHFELHPTDTVHLIDWYGNTRIIEPELIRKMIQLLKMQLKSWACPYLVGTLADTGTGEADLLVQYFRAEGFTVTIRETGTISVFLYLRLNT